MSRALTLEHRWRRSAASLAVALACIGGPGMAAQDTRDLHAYWDSRCKSCHGDAGPFARSTLQVADGRLQGRHHVRDLDQFLQHHYLAADLVDPVKRMLAAQATTPPLFATHCSRCHGSAADLARRSLMLKGDVLVGRNRQQAVADILRTHGALAPAEIPLVVASLRRVLAEVGKAGGAD